MRCKQGKHNDVRTADFPTYQRIVCRICHRIFRWHR